jgi:hypothetical protein
MTRIKTATAKKLNTPVSTADVVNYAGWFQQEEPKRQFRGPPPIPRRSLVSHVGEESGAGRAALATVDLPNTGVLALSDRGVHLLTAGRPLLLTSGQEILFLAQGSYTATREQRAFTVLLSLQLPSGKTVRYESSLHGMPWPVV